MTIHFELEAPFGYSLSAAADFYAGFTPMGGTAQRQEQQLQLAHRLDETFEAVSLKITQRGSTLKIEAEGSTDQRRITTQLTRMLGLDVDGKAWARVGEIDPILGSIKRHYPGFFTAGFPSPYEAGVSGVLSQRSSIKQAAAIRRKLSEQHGTKVGGLFVMPSPQQLLKLKSFAGISERKLEVIQGIAKAALDGGIDATRLRALPTEFALEQLQQLDGVGPWTAAHMLMRGASAQDALPTTEPRVARAFTLAYDRPESDFAKCAEAWRPFRMWASIALVRNLARVGEWSSRRDSNPHRATQRRPFGNALPQPNHH